MGLSVVLPAYKEAENLALLLPKLREALETLGEPFEILVVDSRETLDATKEICEQSGCTYLKREGGDFYGDAIRTGFRRAQQDYTAVMDADGSHNPQDVARLYNEIKKQGCDVVIGSRYVAGGNSCNGFILKMMSYTVNLVYRVVFRIKGKDVSDSFRVYHTAQVKKLKLTCNNFDVVEEILIRLSILNQPFTCIEVPIYFNKRMYGESKRDLVKFIFSYISTILKMYRLKREALKEAGR